MKLEFNVEYRFLLGTLFGIKFKSALFTDIGNIWNWKPIDNSASAVGSDFQSELVFIKNLLMVQEQDSGLILIIS